MTFAFNNQHSEWDVQQQVWILAQISESRTQQAIYDDLTAEESPNRPAEVGRWNGSFNAFKKRAHRLTKNGIDPAIDLDTGQKHDFDLGTPRGRYDYWLWLAKTTADRTTRVQALQMIEKLAPQFEENPDKMTLAKYRANPEANIRFQR